MEEEMKARAAELAKERVDSAVKDLAKMINKNEEIIQNLRWSCDSQGWNDEIVYELEEAQVKLGQALATLTIWFDEDDCES